MIGTPKDPPSRTDAQAFLERFASALEARQPWFLAEVAARGEPAWAHGTVESLDALLDFVATHLEEDRPAEPPEWLNDGHRRRGWTAYGLALAEGLMAYLAALYRERTGATWVLDTDRRSAHFHQPVMSVPGPRHHCCCYTIPDHWHTGQGLHFAPRMSKLKLCL